jgi:hypothetical protein
MFNKIKLFEQSGLSKPDFCCKHRIKQSQFYYWMKIHNSTANKTEESPVFMPVMVEDRVSNSEHDRIVVTAHGGLQVSFPAHTASIPLIRQLLEG